MTEEKTGIPPHIKRNTLYLALVQALVATGFQLIPSLGSLIMLRFTDVLALIGATLSMGKITGPLMSYPAGLLADRKGRKSVLLLGVVLYGIGALLIYYSVISISLNVFMVGLVVNGLGMGALRQVTVAAIDMFPRRLKAEGMGYVMTGTSLGSIGSPLLVWATSNYAANHGMDELALPWLVIPFLMVLSGVLIYMIKPDPLEIARNITDHYPGEVISKGKQAVEQSKVKIGELLRELPIKISLANNALSFAVMSMVMSLSALILRQNKYSVTLISICIGLHVFGMFGFSSVIGRLADRMGRKKMMYIGSVVLGISGFITPLTSNYLIVTTGLFFVGLGWSINNVATVAMLGDSTPPTSMGQMMGVNQLIGGAGSLLVPAIGGYLAQNFGFPAVGTACVLITVPIMFLASKLRETSPGVYDHS
ncbi:MFS transporter [Candidatus Bathyarchaeota archaeon]|nr:MFS transporter [Candidatus Bathyarchaeota archaeon]